MSTEPKAVKRKLSQLDVLAEVYHETNSTGSSLCTRCRELRLEEAIRNIKAPERSYWHFDVKISDVGTYYRQQSNYACNLCRILSSSRVTVDQLRNKPQDCEDGDELHALALYDYLPWVDRFLPDHRWELLSGQSPLYLAVVPSDLRTYSMDLAGHGENNGFVVIRRRDTRQPRIYAPQIVSSRFDLSLARYWLQYCRNHHKRLCPLNSKPTTKLHLIDCRSLEVIFAPDQADYAALSYVWGKPITISKSSNPTIPCGSDGFPLPSPVPTLIDDAICVTIGLGLHYLWVDRYCIDQDSHSKHQQINQMDSIYQNAELTIVAAAGNGPEYGLPGINSRSRRGQQIHKIGDFELIPTLRHPHMTIKASTWFTRGWTFQESVLSRRNLIFTDDQVYFECNAMNCDESFSSDLDTLHKDDKSQFKEVLRAGLFGPNPKFKYGHFDQQDLSPGHNLCRFMGMVEQYTARDLTYDTDSLNAFTGIIRKFETAGTPLSQIWGVPFYRGEDGRRTNDSFVDGLGWSHKVLARDAPGQPRRRPEFPSWSWAGWAGAVQYEERSYNREPAQLESQVQCVFIETGGGLKAGLSAYIDEAKGLPQETISPRAIHILALALPASAFSYDTATMRSSLQVFRYPARLALSTGPWDTSQFFQSLQNANQRRCIYLGHLGTVVVNMVLEAHGSSWSRVGLIYLDEVFYWDFHKSWKEFKMKSRVDFVFFKEDIGEEVASFRII